MTNQIIEMMSANDRKRLEPNLERVELPKAFVMGGPDADPSYSFFPVEGVASIAAQSGKGLRLDAGMFGWEGMSDPWQHLTGMHSLFHTVMLYPGNGYRVANEVVSWIARESDEFRLLLSRYAQTLALQFAYTALAGACLPIEKRLARWLLMVGDRTAGVDIEVTHVTIADQLRVRRQSVTTALHVLDGQGLIRSERRSVTIRRRGELMRFAGEAYGLAEAEYSRLLPASGFPPASLGDGRPLRPEKSAESV